MARPSKYTPEVVNIITTSLRQGDARITACRKAGISDDTFNNWMRENSGFSALVKTAEEEYHQWELNGLMESARKGLRVLLEGQEYEETTIEYEQDPKNPSKPRVKRQTVKTRRIPPSATAIIFALCNRDPDNWKNRVSNEIEARVQADQKADVNLRNIPDDLLEQVIKAINGEQ